METLSKENANKGSRNKINMKINRTELLGITLKDMSPDNSFILNNTEIAFNFQQSLLDLIDGFYFVIDYDFVIKYLSPSVTDKLGFSSEEWIGRSMEGLFSNESSKQLHALLSLTISQGKTKEKKQKLEVEVVNHKNEIRYYHFSFVEMENSDYFVGICQDVHDIIIREKELLNAKNTAEYNDRLKSEFLANMSHEIRTPLNGIVGFTSMLDRKDLPEEKREKYLRIIHSSTHHLLSLVSDIIDISKIEAGQLKIITIRVDIHQMLEDLQATFVAEARRLGKKNLRIIKQIEKPGVRIFFSSDELRLKQVLNNLLGNALKFTSDGDIRFGYSFVDVRTIRFFVRDSGIGISKDAQKLIFHRFKQTKEGEKDIYKGNGLGLAISKGIIELMGGKIDVQSEPGKGAEFFFTLPFVDCK
jgi:PAS domain S-box-containing protein